MEYNEYRIGFNNWIQGELTWKQDKEIASLFNRIRDIADPSDELDFTVEGLFKVLQKYDLLKVFLNILLVPKKDWRYFVNLFCIFGPKVNVLTNSEIALIASDFFLYNKKFVSKLKPFQKALELILKAAGAEISKRTSPSQTIKTTKSDKEN